MIIIKGDRVSETFNDSLIARPFVNNRVPNRIFRFI